MLTEGEVRERAHYCYCVLLQLGWLHDNEQIEPHQYLEYLQNSSLHLAGDAFIAATIEEALLMRQPDAGLSKLLALYEGFVHAFCEVLEDEMETLTKEISRDFLRKLAAEVKVEIKL
jgi:hypothetical protein